MQTLYLSQQGCYASLRQEQVVIKKAETILQTVQLPLLEQILVFGKSQLTTQLIRACLQRDIPIAYLSRMGYCYGRVLAISRGYRQLARYQQHLSFGDRLFTARRLVIAKLSNSRSLLQRQQRRHGYTHTPAAIDQLAHLAQQVHQAEALDQLRGLEGAGAATYFAAFGNCLTQPEFVFAGRSRQPPGNPVNALLSFGYQVLWNHLLTLLELQGLDPYSACLHEGNPRHPALASDLIEEFRAPIVDSLVLQLVNRRSIDATADFAYRDGGCFLGETGRPKYLRAFLQRMEAPIQTPTGEQPHWDILTQQVKRYKQFVYNPVEGYDPYQPR